MAAIGQRHAGQLRPAARMAGAAYAGVVGQRCKALLHAIKTIATQAGFLALNAKNTIKTPKRPLQNPFG